MTKTRNSAAAENAAAVTVMGWLAANFGIRISFAAIGPLLILSLMLTRVLDVKKQPPAKNA